MRLLILSLLCSFVYLLALQTSCFAAKFTMFPMVGRSHYLVLARIGEELESRGHEVKYINVHGDHISLQLMSLVNFLVRYPTYFA